MSTQPPWMGDEPAGGRPLDHDLSCDVVVIGGGIVGISTAYQLASSGVSTVLLEARTVGSGVTGHSSAKLSALQGTAYSTITEVAGGGAAHQYAELNTAGIQFIEHVAERHEFACDLARRPAVSFAESIEGYDELSREAEAAFAAGLKVELRDECELPFPVSGALVLTDQAQFDPVAWVKGARKAVEEIGGEVFENSRATGVDGLRKRTVHLENGRRVEADRVVVATHAPILDRGGFFARMKPMTSFAVSGRIRGLVPEGMYLGIEDPVRSISPIPGDAGSHSVLVAGEGHRPGTASSLKSIATLREYLESRFELEEAGSHWGAHDHMSFDRTPLVGQMLPLDERVLTATGFSKWGLAAGAGSSAVLADHVLGRDTQRRAVFDPARMHLRAVKGVVGHNLDSGGRLVSDRLRRRTDRRDLAPGEGEVTGSPLGKWAVCRDEQGKLHELSARCTHLGCIVAWNAAGQTWDCPCHGSRFAPDGSVVDGPATSSLKPK